MASLSRASISVVREIRSRFILDDGSGGGVDVTLTSHGSRALLVGESGGGGGPTIYVALEEIGELSPAERSRRDLFKAVQRQLKKWRPDVATQLDLYLGTGVVRSKYVVHWLM